MKNLSKGSKAPAVTGTVYSANRAAQTAIGAKSAKKPSATARYSKGSSPLRGSGR